MRLPIRAAAIVIKDDQILLMHRKNKGKEYWVFPGGGVEEGETDEQAVVRELWEETSIKVKVVRLLYHHHLLDEERVSDEYYYLCEHLSGKPKLNESNEKEEMKDGEQYYDPLWVKTSKLSDLILYPIEIRDWLIEDLKTGMPTTVRELTLNSSERQQK